MTQDTGTGVRLVFEGALTMRNADAVRATLMEAIGVDVPVAPDGPVAADVSMGGLLIDCAGASEIDLTFIQLLIAARISAHRLNRELRLATLPDGALLDTLTRGGFQVIDESRDDDPSAFWFERTRG